MSSTKLIVSITSRSKQSLDAAYEAFPSLKKSEVVDLVLQKGVDMLLGTPSDVPDPESDNEETEDNAVTEEYSLFSDFEQPEEDLDTEEQSD